MRDFIEKLGKDRQDWVDLSRKNRFEEGIKNLLTELYPDNAHFIYELLQNAEDAKATNVKFVLDVQGLKFLHNGERQFTENDIDSITSIGQSVKKDDFTQIGKFGVGFKAVFAYTQTPQIYSGECAFEISNLVVPKNIKQIPQISSGKSKATFFHFPFNNPIKTNQKAFQEIREALLKFPDNTILFLQNIKEISWEIHGQNAENGSLKLSKTNENYFEVEINTNESVKTHWLKFEKQVPEKENLFVSIAFLLSKQKDGNEDKYKIEKSVKGGVSVFFPAEKEISNLKFYLNAPFAATVARDSIKKSDENEELRDLLIELLTESLPKIKELGLLDREFLSILPNSDDTLPEFYKSFRDKIIESFQNESLTPTWNGKHLPAKNLFQGNDKIKAVINRETILQSLTKNSDAEWAINAQTVSRAYKFLQNLEIRDLTLKDILDKSANIFSNQEKAGEILSPLSDEWLQSFYELLLEIMSGYSQSNYHQIKQAFIVRLQNGLYAKGNHSYFQTEFILESEKVEFVKPDVCKTESARNFLRKIGVSPVNENTEIKLILEKHYKDSLDNLSEEQHIKHLEKFIEYQKKNRNPSIFNSFSFLKTENGRYEKSELVFIDNPFEEKGLSSLEIYVPHFYFRPKVLVRKFPLWKKYFQLLDSESFLEFLKAIKIENGLTITKIKDDSKNKCIGEYRKKERPTVSQNKYVEDYVIYGLEKTLEKNNKDVSLFVWNTVLKAEKDSLKCRYKANNVTEEQTFPSTFVLFLTSKSWIPDRQGNFHKPQEMTQQMLPDDFIYDNHNGWLDAIEFEKNANQQKREYQIQEDKKAAERTKKEQAAMTLGIDLNKVKKFKENEKEFEEFLRKKEAREQNLARRNSSTQTNNFDSGNTTPTFQDRNRTIEIRERAVVAEYTDTKTDARDFLISQYGDERQLFCQVCQEPMPFQTLNREDYFEAVKIVEKTTADNIANYLCCCANCAAMVKFSNPNKENLSDLILEAEPNEDSDYILIVELAWNECEIRFTEQHFEALNNFIGRQS